MTTTPYSFLKLALLAVLGLLLTGCRGVAQESEAKAAAKPRDPFAVVAAPALLKQLKLGTAHNSSVAGSLRLTGRVEADETRIARVSAPVTGRVTELEVVEGQVVKRGQTLATIYSTELSAAQAAFVKAVSQQQLAQRAAERAHQLLEADVIGSAEVQRREAEYQQSRAELSSALDQLRILGMTNEAITQLEKGRTVNSITHIVATINGTVLERKVTIGQVVQPADTLAVLADLSQVWLVAAVPEYSAGNITVGQSAEAEIAALPGQIIRGKLSFVSAIVNPETRTVRTRMDLPNPRGRFKPAMMATIEIKDGAQNQPVIPSTAIVREENLDYVFEQTGENQFIMRPVQLGAEYGNVRVLAEPLPENCKIVLDGAFHLNNERKRLALQGD